MRVAIGKPAVGCDLVHVIVAEHLEHDREEIEAVSAGDLFYLVLLVPQVARQRRVGGKLRHRLVHFPLPKNSLMLPTTASRSRISEVITRSSLEKCSRKSLTNCPEP